MEYIDTIFAKLQSGVIPENIRELNSEESDAFLGRIRSCDDPMSVQTMYAILKIFPDDEIKYENLPDKYADIHNKIIEYVKRQTNIDLNKYRDGDGSSPFTTSYWERQGPGVAVNWKAIPRVEKASILSLPSVKIETGGAWISYIFWEETKK